MACGGSWARYLGGLAAVALLSACTSALKEPPPVSQLAGPGADPPAGATQTARLLDEAAVELARRPLETAVAHARELYLRAAAADAAPLEAFLGAARATAWLVQHVGDRDRREQLAIEGVQVGQWCRRRFPDHPECRYRLALAVGQQARERPSTATDGLDVMVALLEELLDEAPHLDRAGPHRVLALVLLRAPGWPSGPGDPDTGLEHARAAAAAFPDFPPNQLVLGEALLETGQVEQGREALSRGIELAETLAAAGDADAAEWLAEGRQALDDSR
jgi:hypothetical protein